jgi:molybdopterin converting factor subunit 1
VADVAVTVLLFAAAREAAGTAKETLDLPAGSTVAELAEMLAGRYGESLGAVLRRSAVWVNGEPVPPGTALRAGDEVAVLPPVSGGCRWG